MNTQDPVAEFFGKIGEDIGKAQGTAFVAACAAGILIPIVAYLITEIKRLESESAKGKEVGILFDVMNQRICDLEDKTKEKES